MACTNCTGNSSSLFPKKDINKNIRFECTPTGTSLSVLEGAYAKAKLEMCSWSKPYTQYFQNNMVLEYGSHDWKLSYGGLGTHTTFLVLKITYTPNDSNPCNCINSVTGQPYLGYKYEGEDTERYIDDIMILSGTEEHPIPPILLSNDNKFFDVNIEVLASNETVINKAISDEFSNGDNVIDIKDLVYKDLYSDNEYLWAQSSAGTVVKLRWVDIEYYQNPVELNGKIVTISDYVRGDVNFIFSDEYNAKQGFSLIMHALCDKNNKMSGSSNISDDTEPVINYSPEFTTEIILADFPPAPTCGTAGNEVCGIFIGTNGEGIMYKEDLFEYLIDGAVDDRDCILDFTYNNITLQEVGSVNKIDAIDTLGKYHMDISVSDNAGNINTDSFILNVKDIEPPMLITSTLGSDLIDLYNTSGIAYVTLNSGSYIEIENGFSEINIKLDGTSGDIAYMILEGTPIEIKAYEGTAGTVFEIDPHSIGSGPVSWDTATEEDIVKVFELNENTYGIRFDREGSFYFGIIEDYSGTDGTSGL